MITFKRILHPVGQGAFFTEQFFDDAGNSFFNVVYDCGELRTNRHLEPEIDNTLFTGDGKPLVINVFFISHLDEDHISGIKLLVDKGCLTKRSLVILPFNYPLVIKLILQSVRNNPDEEFAGGAYDVLNSLFDTDAKILGIGNSDEYYSNDPISLDDGLSVLKEYEQLKSYQSLTYNNIWNYIPFNTILDDNRYRDFQNQLELNKIDKSRLADINYVSLQLPVLKEIYGKLSGDINGVTAINVNSLNVLSYSPQKQDCYCAFVNNMNLNRKLFHHIRARLIYYCNCSCLYTGDSVMEKHFEDCLRLLINKVIDRIGMIQIPHHGRDKNYNRAIVFRNRFRLFSGFTNYNSTHKKNKYIKQIERDFSAIGRPFVNITEGRNSRFVLYVRIL